MVLDIDSVCGAIDNNLAALIHTVIVIMKFGVPILLIIFGMLDIAKGVVASKEDEIKKGQGMFIKRLISAALVFFVVTIVQLVIQLADDKNDTGESDVWQCANMIMNGKTQNRPNIPDNQESGTTGKTSNGLTCKNKSAAIQYDTCMSRNSSAENTNLLVCGTIFNKLCDTNSDLLWYTIEPYKEEVVNKLDWYNSFENINEIKQVYYDCVYSGLSEETCKGFFEGFYAIR